MQTTRARALNTAVLTSDALPFLHLDMLETLSTSQKLKWYKQVFGKKITKTHVVKLTNAIQDGKSIILPKISIRSGYIAGFDANTETILIGRGYINNALTSDPKAKALLLHILLEEYGHQIDYCLRNHFSNIGGDSKGDEGARFAIEMAEMLARNNQKLAYAIYTNKQQYVLSANTMRLKSLFNDTQRRSMILIDEFSHDRRIEYFSAGRGDTIHNKFGHWSIEDAMLSVGYSQEHVDQIYYGNWLRDYSQIVDKMLIEGVVITLAAINVNHIAPSELRLMFTEIVHLTAELEFEPQGFFTGSQAVNFQITPAILGVYRPEEHLDNPLGITGTVTDRSFRPDYQAIEGQIDPDKWRKRYFDTSITMPINPTTGQAVSINPVTNGIDYIKIQLQLAKTAGETVVGRRHFGQAMHTLEDLYAHSNYIELSITQIWQDFVANNASPDWRPPWPKPKLWVNSVPVNGSDVDIPPLVTGTFALADTAASLLSIVEKHFDHELAYTPHERAAGSRLMLIILRRVDANMASSLDSFLTKLEDIKRRLGLDNVGEIIFNIKQSLFAWVKNLLAAALRVALNTIAQYQTNTSGHDPSHSQIAKDADDHPLHPLTAKVAQKMVQQMGTYMKLYWSNGSHNGTSVNHAFMASIVENYFVHPFKAQSLGSTEIDELNDIIRSYAEQATQADNANRSVLRRAATYGGHDHHHDELTDNLQSAFNWMVELNTLVGPIFARNRMPTIVELNRIWHWLTNADDQSGHLSRGGTGVGSQLSNIARSFIYGL